MVIPIDFLLEYQGNKTSPNPCSFGDLGAGFARQYPDRHFRRNQSKFHKEVIPRLTLRRGMYIPRPS
jgi:hypothetical protein